MTLIIFIIIKTIHLYPTMKFTLALALVGSAAAFAPQASVHTNTALNQHIGSGGMADTRNPDAMAHEDPRKSISAAPSFEEYLKERAAEGTTAAAPAAAAPAAAAPAAAAPAAVGGGVASTLSGLQGAGHVWGADGIAVGKEESDIRGHDGFSKFTDACAAAGIDLDAAAYTIFAPTDSCLESYEKMRGPVTADVLKMHIVEGKIASSDIPSATLNSLNGPLTYRYAVRKHFVNDAIIGETTFGAGADFPIDVSVGNSVIHTVGLCFGFY
mmetsp:Transcript_5718/g.7206  ORF Transcript_5718/g.7206 Transcript_5718/m.7206 type:complete len:270 (+) Transcript_5718:3-812(+)